MMKGFNKYQLQEELKKALEERKPDGGKYFYYRDFLTVEFSDPFWWIYADWRGYQTEHSVKEGCEKILEAVKLFQCPRLLNDNTNINGIWAPASPWIGTDWLPRILDADITNFAWVYSPGNINRVLADEAIKNTKATGLVQTFDSIDDAREWLEAQKDGQQ